MKKWNRIVSLILTGVLAGGMLTSCTYKEPVVKDESSESELDDSGFVSVNGEMPIEDNFSLYENWNYDEVVTMYLTVRTGNESDGTNHTWEEVNTYSAYYYDELGVDRYKVEGLLQVGDEEGPLEGELGYGQYAPNSVVQIRGQTSSNADQKNYRITLREDKGDWEGMSTLNLNKHVYDGTRFTNMLCYYWMQQIDGMMSARTKFVHLYVKDETASGDDGAIFEDYGLYTCVEQINKSYLRKHNQDKNGQLYKVEFFEFYPYEDVIMLKSDADYDLEEFENYLEIKGNDDHGKLIQMLKELNDYSIPIEDTFSKWFDEENYFTWLAFHLMVGNTDTQSRNMFLYSPNSVNKFYIISWDNDGSMKKLQYEAQEREMEYGFTDGISNYWGNVLHRRVLQSDEYRKKLDDKINELREFFTEEKVQSDVELFAGIVKPYVYSLPDAEYTPVNASQHDYIVKNYHRGIEDNYQRYLDSLEKPMPFFLGTPDIEGGKISFQWDSAYDFDRETITYHFELSKDYSFGKCVHEKEGLLEPGITIDVLEPGQYFYRVTASNTSGYEMTAFDSYYGDNGTAYGVKCFWVSEDGVIHEE